MTEELTNLKLMGFSIEVETDPITLQLQTDKGPFSVEISKTQLAKLVYALRSVLYAEEPLQRKRLRKEAEVELVPAPSEEPKESRRSKAMPNLYEILADAQNGEAMAGLGREFGLSPPGKLRPRWRRFCPPYPWASSDRRQHPKGSAIYSA